MKDTYFTSYRGALLKQIGQVFIGATVVIWSTSLALSIAYEFLINSHGSGTPVVAECDGDYTYEKRGALLWQLPMIDAKNKTGSIEFSCGGNPDDFFPVQVAFFSKKSYSGIEVYIISVFIGLFHSLFRLGMYLRPTYSETIVNRDGFLLFFIPKKLPLNN